MSASFLRYAFFSAIVLFPSVICHADEADVVKQIRKAGGHAVKISGEYGAAFDGNKATEDNLKLLLELPKVTSLRLSDNTRMTDAAFRIVGQLKSLRQLHVFQSNVTDAGLMELRGLDNLEEIILDRTAVTGPGAAGLKNLPKLSKVRLNGPSVTNAALKYLQEIPNLYSLDLSNTKVTDQGISDLRGMKKMGQLSLHGTAITDNSLRLFQDLNGFERLGMLTVSKTQVTKAGVDELKKARSANKKRAFSVTF